MHSCAHISCIWSITRDLLVTVTCDRLIRLQITGANGVIAQWDTKERYCCAGLQWHLSSETGCIMVDLFTVLMYLRGAHLSASMYTWLERMEISCGVNVTFLSVIPLSSSPSVAPSFGIFLKRSNRELVLRTVLGSSGVSARRQRPNFKREWFLIQNLGLEHLQNGSRKELIGFGVYLTWLKNILITTQEYETWT